MNPAPSMHSKMYHVYLLQSQKDKSFYIGYTKNIEYRLKEHNVGLVEYTRKYMPWRLIYYEPFISLKDAKKREKTLKSFGKAYQQLKLRLSDSLKVILNNKEGAG